MIPHLQDDPNQYHQNSREPVDNWADDGGLNSDKRYDGNGIMIADDDIEGCIADWHVSKKAKECNVNLNDVMPDCLYKAMVHAQAVSRREHHKSDLLLPQRWPRPCKVY